MRSQSASLTPADSNVKSWDERQRKRERSVHEIMLSPNYRQALLSTRRGDIVDAEWPATPDATDMSVSKRVWEREVKAWRGKLRQLANGTVS